MRANRTWMVIEHFWPLNINCLLNSNWSSQGHTSKSHSFHIRKQLHYINISAVALTLYSWHFHGSCRLLRVTGHRLYSRWRRNANESHMDGVISMWRLWQMRRGSFCYQRPGKVICHISNHQTERTLGYERVKQLRRNDYHTNGLGQQARVHLVSLGLFFDDINGKMMQNESNVFNEQ